MNSIGLFIPLRNGGELWRRWLDAFAAQTVKPAHRLVIDSSSSDGGAELARAAGFDVHVIPADQFNHGATRQLGASMLADAEIVIFMTHDAVLATPDALEKLLAGFTDKQIGAAYGRQLPHPGGGALGAHARLFNYPAYGAVKTLADAPRLGIKTAFLSDSFAAYRRGALAEAGGFPAHVILGEDTFVAAKMLLNDWNIAYCAEAQVFHSHDYTLSQEFGRYFDTGVFHGREPWIRREFGQPTGEGMRFVRSELHYLARTQPFLIPSALVRTAFKFAGYKLGKLERHWPLWLKRRLSMYDGYWGST
ncbi:MAG: glycosyltransferase family 2 protein [Sulfuricellaceae bacterium]